MLDDPRVTAPQAAPPPSEKAEPPGCTLRKAITGGFQGEAGVFAALHRWLQALVNEAAVNGKNLKKKKKRRNFFKLDAGTI